MGAEARQVPGHATADGPDRPDLGVEVVDAGVGVASVVTADLARVGRGRALKGDDVRALLAVPADREALVEPRPVPRDDPPGEAAPPSAHRDPRRRRGGEVAGPKIKGRRVATGVLVGPRVGVVEGIDRPGDAEGEGEGREDPHAPPVSLEARGSMVAFAPGPRPLEAGEKGPLATIMPRLPDRKNAPIVVPWRHRSGVAVGRRAGIAAAGAVAPPPVHGPRVHRNVGVYTAKRARAVY